MKNVLKTKNLLGALALACFAGSAAHATIAQNGADGLLGQQLFTTGASGNTASTLKTPLGVAYDASGNLWVADSANNRILEYVAPFTKGMNATLALGVPTGAGNLTTIGAGGFASGAVVTAPQGIAFDSAGNLWVADTGQNRILMFPKANLIAGGAATIALGINNLTTTGRQGFTTQGLISPSSLVFDPAGNLWVADTGNNRVQKFAVASLVMDGAATSAVGAATAGTTGTMGFTAQGMLAPVGLAFDAFGNLYVGDNNSNRRVLQFLAANLVANNANASATIALGAANATSPGAGGAFATTLASISGIAFSTSSTGTGGQIWVTDTGNNRVVMYQAPFTNGETATTVLGQPNLGLGTANSGVGISSGGFSAPAGLAFDGSGNISVADQTNNRVETYLNPLSFFAGGVNPVIFTAVSSGSLAFQWSNSSTGVSPVIVLSTTTPGTAPFTTVIASATASGTSVGQSTVAYPGSGGPGLGYALFPNTSYFFEVKDSTQADSDYVVTSTSTFAIVPAAAAAPFSAIGSSGAAVSWMTNGNPVNFTTYTVVFSTISNLSGFFQNAAFNLTLTTAPFKSGVTNGSYASTLVSASTQSLGYPYVGTTTGTLIPNTSYFTYVNAVNYNSVGTTFTALGSFATLAVPPTTFYQPAASSEFAVVTSSIVQVNWSSGTSVAGVLPGAVPGWNPLSQTLYSVVLSTVSGNTGTSAFLTATGNVSLSTTPAGTLPTATVSGLTGNTTYFLYVAAVNLGNGNSLTPYVAIGSVTVESVQPVSAAQSSIGNTSAVVNLGIGVNATGTQYFVAVATEASYLVAGASVTAYTSSSFTYFTGLAAGQNYFAKAQAVGYDGNRSVFTPLPTFTTSGGPVAAPTKAATTFTTVQMSSITVQWTAASGVSSYTVVAATDPTFGTITTLVLTTSTAVTFGPPGNGTGLSQNVQYFFSVQSTATLGASQFVSLGSTFTLTGRPTASAVSTTGGTPQIFQTSATITWMQNAADPVYTSAWIDRSTSSDFNTITVTTITPANTATAPTESYTDNSLRGCSTYFFRVADANGNGVPNGFDLTASGPRFLTLVTSNTVPAPATGLTATPQTGNKILLNWNASATEGITLYTLYGDSGSAAGVNTNPLVPGTTIFGVFGSSITSFTTNVLNSSGTYTFKLTATHRCGVQETAGSTAFAGSTGTLAAVRAGLTSPVGGSFINGGAGGSNAVTLAASLLSGAPINTSQIVFQYQAAGASSWVTIGTATTLPYAVSWNPSPSAQPSPDTLTTAANQAGYNLSNNNSLVACPGAVSPATFNGANGCLYNLRAIAYDLNSTSDTFASSIQVTLIPTQNAATLGVASVAQLNALVGFESTVQGANAALGITNPAAIIETKVLRDATTQTFQTGTGANLAGASIMTGTFGGGPGTVIFSPNPVTAAGQAGQVGLMPFGYKPIIAQGVNATTLPLALKLGVYAPTVPNCTLTACSFNPGTGVQLSIGYPNVNNDGTIDGTNPPVRADSVKILSRSEAVAGAVYVADVAMLKPDLVRHIIYGITRHATFFSVAGIPSADLSAVRVYPVPWKPNGTDPNEGRPVAAGAIPAANQGIIFDNMPANFTIKIYTVSGTLVTQKTVSGGLGTGTLVWDGRNDASRDVASGGYFAVISAPGLSSIVKRLAIIR